MVPFLALFLGLGVCGQCSRPPTLLVTVNKVPPSAASLAAYIIKTDPSGQQFSSRTDLQPYDLPGPGPAPDQESFVLRMPDGMAADLTVSAAAFSQAQASGCLLASGSAEHMFQPSLLDDSVTIDLNTGAMDSACQGDPRIVAASPAILHAAGGDTLTVSGWGFRPGSQLTLDGVTLTTTYRSAGQLEAAVPAAMHIGLVPLSLTVPGLPAVTYNGLRYVVDTIAFPASVTTPTFPPLLALHAADLNGDGQPDLASVPIATTGNDVTVLLQTQPLTFISKTYTLATTLADLAAVDVDKDGDIDLITASGSDKTLRLLRNDGSGNFTAESQSLAFNVFALAAGDISGDGVPDVVLLDNTMTKLYTLQNDGTGHFGTPMATTLSKVVGPTQITLMDFDLDGKLDALLDSMDFANSVYGVGVLLNQGNKFAATDAGVMMLSLPDFFDLPLLTRDIDGDGKPDLLVSVSAESFHFYGSTAQPPRAPQIIPPSCNVLLPADADLNGDGRTDLFMSCAGMSQVQFMLQTASGGFTAEPQAPPVTLPNIMNFVTTDVQAVDLNGDRKPELLIGSGSGYFLYKNISQ